MKPIDRGAALGVLAACLLAICVTAAATPAHFVYGVPFTLITMTVVLLVPGLVIGAALGWLAGTMRGCPIWLRRCVLVAPAMLLVAWLGYTLDLYESVVAWCAPTAACVLVLERSTRFVAVPVARALSAASR